MGQPRVSAYDRSLSDDSVASQYCGIGIYDHIVLYIRIPFLACKRHTLTVKRGQSSQCDTLVYFHPVSYGCGLSDYYTCSMVDEEALSYGCSRMYVYSCLGMGPLAHHPWNDRDFLKIQYMCDSMGGNSFQKRIAEHYLIQ